MHSHLSTIVPIWSLVLNFCHWFKEPFHLCIIDYVSLLLVQVSSPWIIRS